MLLLHAQAVKAVLGTVLEAALAGVEGAVVRVFHDDLAIMSHSQHAVPGFH